MKPYLLLPLAVALLAVGCKKDETDPNGLPPATQDGKNTAGFLLNGQPWLPKLSPTSTGPYPVGISLTRIQGLSRLSVSFSRYQDNDNRQSLGLYISGIKQPGTFALNQLIDPYVISGPQPPYGVYAINAPSPRRSFYTGSDARGQVIITRFDTVARIVAGTFEAKLKEDGGADSLSITQGRFDIKF